MAETGIFHALCLHLHQPSGNLAALVGEQGDGRRILSCYQRLVNAAHKYSGVGRFNLIFSAPLLAQCADPEVVEAWRPQIDLPSLLDGLRRAGNVEVIASGMSHRPFSEIPAGQWAEELAAERQVMEDLLGRVPRGFHPPADDLPPALVPLLVQAGYRYVLLPASRLVTVQGGAPVDPRLLCRLVTPNAGILPNEGILAVPYDDGLSAAQFRGLDVAWFADELKRRASGLSTAVFTTLSDGENGEWFRTADDASGFFGAFLPPYLEFCETGEYPARPIMLSDAVAQAGAVVEAVLADWPDLSGSEASPPVSEKPRRKMVRV